MKHCILFVDDEPNILDGLRRSLHAYRQEWSMLFAGSGAEALRMLAASPGTIDVVVTDMRMPGMNGDELLAAIRRDYPAVIRMGLTGQCTQQAMLRMIQLAHRVFTKPLAPEELKKAIHRACSLQQLLRSESLSGLVCQLGSLPSPPLLHARILDELQSPEGSLGTVAKLISQDIGLMAKLMQVVNSALLGPRQPTTDPVRAVSVLGAESIRALVLMAGVFTRYDPAALRPFSIDHLWEHSQAVAALAGRLVEAAAPGPQAANARMAGLFHDVGRLVLAIQAPDSYREVLRLAQQERMLVIDAERQVFAATHAEVGAYLLGLWGMPEPLVEAVAWHHTPASCPGDQVEPLTGVHAAEALLAPEEGGPPDIEYLGRLGIDDRLVQFSQTAATSGGANR